MPWQRLLQLLDDDPRRASAGYRALRERLIDVFRSRALAGAEDLADEVFDRVVARMADGEEIRCVDAFVLGVARRVALEAARRAIRVGPFDDATARSMPSAGPDEPAWADERLERCLAALPGEVRAQLAQYYDGCGRARIARRKDLADQLGIGLNALRLRMHRLRGRLLASVERCGEGLEASEVRV